MVDWALDDHVKRLHIAAQCKYCNNWMPDRSMHRHIRDKHSGQYRRRNSPFDELKELIAMTVRDTMNQENDRNYENSRYHEDVRNHENSRNNENIRHVVATTWNRI